MPRFRRYRVFVACALFLVFLLYRVSSNSAWDEDFESQFQYVAAVLPNPGRTRPAQDGGYSSSGGGGGGSLSAQTQTMPHPPPDSGEGGRPDDDKVVKIPELKSGPVADDNTYALPAANDRISVDAAGGNSPSLVNAAGAPDRQPGEVQDNPLQVQDPPGRYEPGTTFSEPIHWIKQVERFPIEEDSLIPLPSGTPRSIPTIQHSFGPETDEARARREDRLDQIRMEAQIAWAAYSQYAFGHDELLVSGMSSRDPFCGWGATLVDSLDTLWIMGLKDEFEEAYSGLNDIDFTTTNRNDIPVFETTIRYLGGLLAAYDVTGGHKGDYPLLLKKAVELAEVLMGVFDTPNRMPILYYQWKPAYASQPKRASTRAGIAEVGTLSMEFTRLAQLTGKDKYYDAVARITNALEEWQNRDDHTASLIPGIFPENIDASGCNKTAKANKSLDSASSLAKQQAAAAEDSALHEPEGYNPKKAAKSPEIELRDNDHISGAYKGGSSSRSSSSGRGPVQEPLGADGLPTDWECEAQDLAASSGTQSFGMGGSQDSAYEYFPKQYLLLGGLEAKYRSMHEKTVAAVKEHLLYRPLTPDNADILFSSKLTINPANELELPRDGTHGYEVTHLACFLGGMFAMGGKIFDSDEDLDIGRRLTDGCVWAYASMPTGIMAEIAFVTPCLNAGSCEWNETAWHLAIDPNPRMREDQMEAYIERLAQWKIDKDEALRAEAVLQQAAEELGTPVTHAQDSKPHPKSGVPQRDRDDGSMGREDDVPYRAGRTKRNIDPVSGDTLAFDPSLLNQEAIEEKIRQMDEEYFGEPEVPSKPHRPQTHEEFVADRIRNGGLPPGYTQVTSNAYQLRPEAIESVWYMYRITGDPTWQEKGWKMWQSVIAHVRNNPAHSAINGVNDLTKLRHAGTMESFWIAETLKYFYLLFSEPDVVSLDDWVLNTEAHPFRRPS
ncbi:family 47 glycoside hydrolase [Cryphonectria parasitica EP155]|uniref:alpha-1,2-Mannosidase n=1 Tax=Cryphonectria parasitica (strain ATCC 38755 / EP155) TaxID=660469 RepID=A0A9P5CL71_CRYP1|nr:family 47 glycoside hydrolase [Cryphonectria parasitica EP155]KAF3763024.1 family 47 glycoside hydrolase [Cryphonectria parasitica EP155]